MKRLSVVFLLHLSFFVSGQNECPTLVHSGTASFYSDGYTGTCSFPTGEVPVNFCAVNQNDYATAGLCGACLEVTGAAGITTVYVVSDFVATAGYLDLSPNAFEEAIGPQSLGSGNVTWRVINCPYFSVMPIELTNVGSNPYFASFIVHKHTNPIESVEIFVGGIWQNLTRQDYNAWTNVGVTLNNESYLDARVTDIFGQQVLVTNIDMNNTGLPFVGNGNFTPCSAADVPESDFPQIQVLQAPESLTLISAVQPVAITLFDLNGKSMELCISEKSDKETTLSTANLARGFYNLSIEFEGLPTINKLVNL